MIVLLLMLSGHHFYHHSCKSRQNHDIGIDYLLIQGRMDRLIDNLNRDHLDQQFILTLIGFASYDVCVSLAGLVRSHIQTLTLENTAQEVSQQEVIIMCSFMV